MVDPVAAPRAPRHGLLLLIVVGGGCVLAGAFILLWFRLPVWAPAWVIAHSPWVEPIMRAAEEGGAGGSRQHGILAPAIERLAGRGPAVVPAMIDRLGDGSPVAVEVAASVLAHFTDDAMCRPLVASMRRHASRAQVEALRRQTPSVVVDALLPLPAGNDFTTLWTLELSALVADPRLVPALAAIVWEPEPPPPPVPPDLDGSGGRWVMAAWALARSPEPAAIPALMPAFADRDPVIRRRAIEGVWRLFQHRLDPRLADAVRRAIVDEDRVVRRFAAFALGHAELPDTEDDLLRLSRSPDPDDRYATILALGRGWLSIRAIERLGDLLVDEDERIRKRAESGVKEALSSRPSALLVQCLASPHALIRRLACQNLVSTGITRGEDQPAVQGLIRMLDDPVAEVAAAAASSLEQAGLDEAQRELVAAALRRRRQAPAAGVDAH
jgi:HEAT repeat protein